MRYDYRTFVIAPPRLLEEQPQLTDHVVRTALENTFGRRWRRGEPATVASVSTTRLDDGQLRVANSLFRGPGVAGTQSSYAAAFRHNIHEAARAVERDGITYLLTEVPVPRAFIDNPELREVAVRGAVERAFPELVGQQYHLNHDLHCKVAPHRTTNQVTASDYLLDVALTADARCGLDGRDAGWRAGQVAERLRDRMRELAGGRDPGGIAERCGGGDEGAAPSGHVTQALPPIALFREHARAIDQRRGVTTLQTLQSSLSPFDREDSLVAAALERTFPELRGAEYGFDYELDEDSVLQITLSARPQQSQRARATEEATEAWEVSLAASPSECAAALDANLVDIIDRVLDDVERAAFERLEEREGFSR